MKIYIKNIFLKKQGVGILKRFGNARSGFSLIESLIAVFIFALTMTMITSVFSGFLKNYLNEKKTQKSLENAQYAMNFMAKSLRASSVVAASDFPLYVYDYSQGKCVKYDYSENMLSFGTIDPETPGDPGSCATQYGSISNMVYLTSNVVEKAYVKVDPSVPGSRLGTVTMALLVKDEGQTTSELPIQMTVSLRQ